MASTGLSVEVTASPRPVVRITAWQQYLNRLLAKELSRMTRYFDCVYQWLPRTHDTRRILADIDAPVKAVIEEGQSFPDLSLEEDRRTAIMVNGTFNHHYDI